MDALSSSYAAGIDPLNAGNLSAQQQTGLYSLMPQSGYGLTPTPDPTALPNMGQILASLPAPSVAGTKEQSELQGWNEGPAGYGGNAGFVTAQPTGIGETSTQPDFDNWYPYESLLSEQDYLDSQVGAGAQQAAQARGLDYSGVAPAMAGAAKDYIAGMGPNLTPVEAEAQDFERLYGPDVANALEKPDFNITPNGQDGGMLGSGITSTPEAAPLAGATPFGDGTTTDYSTGLVSLYNPSADQPPVVVGSSGDEFYGGPGYLYNAFGPPNNTPWLNPA